MIEKDAKAQTDALPELPKLNKYGTMSLLEAVSKAYDKNREQTKQLAEKISISQIDSAKTMECSDIGILTENYKQQSLATANEVNDIIVVHTITLREGFFKKIFWATFSFSILAYLLIFLNYCFKLGMSESVMLALLVQVPIQLIGIFIIIAKNLFPETKKDDKPKF